MSAEGTLLPLLITTAIAPSAEVGRLRKVFHPRRDSYAPSQQFGGAFTKFLQDFKAAAQFVNESGHVSSGRTPSFARFPMPPQALDARVLSHLTIWGSLRIELPLIAGHRAPLYKLMRFLWGKV
jgi:hypothetical protein